MSMPEEIKDDPRIGVAYYILYSMQMAAVLYITKGLYLLNPGIEVMQVTSMKALIACIVLIVFLNKDLKYVMYDRIDNECKWPLIFKTIQTTASIFIQYNAMKYFTVSITGVIYGLTPLIACALAAVFLKEKMTLWTITSVIIVLSCVLMILLGAKGEEEQAMESNMLALVLLCM